MADRSHASQLNSQQVRLRQLLEEKTPYEQIRPILLIQHACLHAQAMAGSQDWSYQDEVLAGLAADEMRIIPTGEDHSITWLIWHLTRCEDITMNMLVAERDQVLLAEHWLDRLNISWRDTGNAMTPDEIHAFSQAVDITNLFDYRLAVGRATQELISKMVQETVYRKVNPAAIQRIREEGAVIAEAWGIAEYWSKRDVAGLLLMPATRHNLSHLNEALAIKKKVLKAQTK